jgi:hypothetical protein
VNVFTVNDKTFKTEPLFVFNCTHDEMAAYLKRRFRVAVDDDETTDGLAGQMLTFTRSPWRVVWVKDATRKNLPVILHEVFHLVTRICADKGIPIIAHLPSGENGDEAAAYLFEFFARRVLKKVRA